MWPLLLILCVLCVAATSAGQNPLAGTDTQKFEAAREFVRARNARDYAINTPNGIDEAKYLEPTRTRWWAARRHSSDIDRDQYRNP
jgi:hypothetical protein